MKPNLKKQKPLTETKQHDRSTVIRQRLTERNTSKMMRQQETPGEETKA